MFLLVVMCVSITCEAPFVAEAVAHTYEQCREEGESRHSLDGEAWLCVKDLPLNRKWSEFE